MKKKYLIAGLVTLIVIAIGALIAINLSNARPQASQTTPARPVATGTPTPHASAASPADPEEHSNVLVVYFSRAGQNYGGQDLQVGNTAQIAQFIHESVGGDIYEIVPADPYDGSYEDTLQRATEEQTDRVFPEIAGTAPDTSGYDTVFIGYPIWNGEQPMVVQTFLRDHDLNHATVIPFVTHEGSGFGNSLAVLRQYYPDATILDGFQRRGSDVARDPDAARQAVDQWLRQSGF